MFLKEVVADIQIFLLKLMLAHLTWQLKEMKDIVGVKCLISSNYTASELYLAKRSNVIQQPNFVFCADNMDVLLNKSSLKQIYNTCLPRAVT